MEKLTLLTTNMEMYRHPRHFPGYTGYVPRTKFTYGDTFGNMTAQRFHDYREETLNTSKERMGKGGDKNIPFPTYYSHNPKLVIGATTRSRDRWLASPKYALHNSHNRDEEIKYFDKKAQEHREHYRDRTRTVPPVKIFILPQLFHDTKPKGYPQGGKTFDERKAIAYANSMYRTINATPLAKSSVETRRIRDVFFERR